MRLFLFLICLFVSANACAEEFQQVACAMHISSTISDGKYSIADILATAKADGVQVLIITDRDLMRWEYGLWPLQGIIRKTVSQRSIFTYGVQRYLDEIEKLNRYNPDCILLPAVESAPFYFWQGSVFRDNLVLKNWHVHMLAVGLDKTEDFSGLPIIGNKSRFDQYHGDQGAAPYQQYIEYVRSKGGMSFWVHPQAANSGTQGTVAFQTDPCLHLLSQTSGYSGIAIFHDGYEQLGSPGMVWDRLLGEYSRGERAEPVWAVAGLGYERQGDLAASMHNLRLILLMRSFERLEALAALREGRCYIASGSDAAGFVLDDFSAIEKIRRPKAIAGQTLVCVDAPQIHIKGRLLRGQSKEFKIQLIRNGVVERIFDVGAEEFEVIWKGQQPPRQDYYRLVIESPFLRVVSNPIFVKSGEDQ